jgi:hypothetical protein
MRTRISPMRGSLLALTIAAACSEAPVAPLEAPLPSEPTTTAPPNPSQPVAPAAIGSVDDPIVLTGGGVLAEYTITNQFGSEKHWLTAFTAASGPMVEESGKCCRILADTLLQVNIQGIVDVGPRTVAPPRLEIGGADFRRYGGDDVVLMVRETKLRMRFYVPIKPVEMEITHWSVPREGVAGEIRGSMSFEALVLVQERAGILEPQLLRQEGTTVVHARFATPMRYEARTITIPPPSQ